MNSGAMEFGFGNSKSKGKKPNLSKKFVSKKEKEEAGENAPTDQDIVVEAKKPAIKKPLNTNKNKHKP